MPDRPNIVVITCHDAGRHFGCYGVETVHTPAVDALANDGHTFTDYFTTSPVCSPSRGAMLTGRYPQSNGLIGLTHSPWDWSFNEGEQHLSHVLRDAGYYTGLFGLQHEDADTGKLGFADTFAQRNDTGSRATALDVAESFSTFCKSDAAANSPFYAQIGFFETHRPHDFGDVEPDASKGVFIPPYLVDEHRSRREMAVQQGACRRVDDAVAIISEALDDAGLADNTIFVFTVDHGIEFPRAKWLCYDAGIEVALIVRWPDGGISGGASRDRLLSNVDLFPTLLDLIDAPIPENVEGLSFADYLQDASSSPKRDAVFSIFQSKDIRSVRTERHKLIRNFSPRRLLQVPYNMTESPAPREKCPVVQLFDLEKDPLECNNLAEDPKYADIRKDLSDKLWDWMESVEDPSLKGPMPSPYYLEAIAEYQTRA